MIKFRAQTVVAIGEAMIEMAVTGAETYKRSFAGDTFNTAWHMAQIAGGDGSVGFVTKLGTDSVSDAFVALAEADGMGISGMGRKADRTMGLYMIELRGVEREFHYWRTQSAARCLADDADWLEAAIGDAGLIHLSGITLAILSPEARETLFAALSRARAGGAQVSFDPNIRPKLWASSDDARGTVERFLTITDIALPSFDDEVALWGDASTQDTIQRLQQLGVAEVAVKNGADAVSAWTQSGQISVETPPVSDIRDTSGAGDAFNAGYLAARLMGRAQAEAIGCGQRISAEVIRHFGARIPKASVPTLG